MQRRPEGRVVSTRPAFVDIQPSTEWFEDPVNYVLVISLPGFTTDDIRLRAVKDGKLTIWGRRRLDRGRFARFERTFDMPKDSDHERVSGRFEDSKLYITIPKAAMAEPEKSKEEPTQQAKPKTADEERKAATEEKKEEPLAEQRREEAVKDTTEEPRPGEKQLLDGLVGKEAAVDKDKPSRVEEKNKEGEAAAEEEKVRFEGQRKEEALKEITEEPRSKDEETKIAAEKREEPIVEKQKPSRVGEKNEEGEAAVQDKPLKETAGEPRSKAEEIKMASEKQHLNGLERKGPTMLDLQKREEPTVEKEKPSTVEEKKAESLKKDEPAEEPMPNKPTQSHEEVQQTLKEKESRKRCWFWVDWMDSGIDDLLNKINRNRVYIAVALLAFSTGVYFTKKLRRRG